MIFISSCELFEDEEPEPSPPDPQEELLAVANIGPDGGLIESDDFALELNAGSLNTVTEIKLYRIVEDTPENNQISDSYRIDGFPADFVGEVHISLKYNTTPVDSTVISAGHEAYIPELDSNIVIYYSNKAIDSAGFITSSFTLSQIVTAEGNARKRNIDLSYIVKAFDGIRVKSSEHFLITYNIVHETKVNQLSQALEEIYSGYEEWGIDYYNSPIRNLVTPITVLFEDLGYLYGKEADHPWHTDIGIMERFRIIIDENKFESSDMQVLKPALSSVFYNLIMKTYDPYQTIYGSLFYHRAIALWSEQIFSTSPSYIPSMFASPGSDEIKKQVVESPLLGLYWLSRRGCIGKSAIIKYLTDQYDKNWILSYLEALRNGTEIKQAFKTNIPGYYEEWWSQFVKEYVSGEIYNVDDQFFLDMALQTFIIDSEDDSLFNPNDAYEQISAQMYRINFEYTPSSDETTLNISTLSTAIPGENRMLHLFQINSEQLTYQLSAQEIIVQDLNTLAQQNTDLLVVVCNSYFNENNVDDELIQLVVEKKESSNFLLEIAKASVFFEVSGEFIHENDSISYGTINAGSGTHPVIVDGNTCTAVWNEGYSYGEMEVVYNPQNNSIESFYYTSYYDDQASQIEFTQTVQLHNIPYYQTLEGVWVEYQVSGTGTCNHISQFEFLRYDYGDEKSKALQNFYCEEQYSPFINVKLYLPLYNND